MLKILTFLFILFLPFISESQEVTQNIKGRFSDKESKSPLIGVTVAIYRDSSLIGGTSTDLDGKFKVTDLPIGKYRMSATMLGYLPVNVNNLNLNSGKELVINFEMEETVINVTEVEIVAGSGKQGSINEMATVSARTFSVEESNRYAGSRGDPARMASNFAGVQGANDSRNDIVIRGNSPQGVVYRLDGVDIPNPNHFAVAGTSGGPVSILNNKVLDNSDFLTGAFPAEYGNSTAGVFDLHMRNGNNEKHEFTGQLGFLGTELTAEGPISAKSGASYLATYRYSTLKLFESLKIPIGTSAIPNYQDASFKLNFPLKKNFNLSFFGIGGQSSINIVLSKLKSDEANELYGSNNRDQYFNTALGVVGMSLSKQHSATTYSKLVVAANFTKTSAIHKLIYRNNEGITDSLVHKLGYTFREDKIVVNYFLNKKINSHHSLKAGILNSMYLFNMIDSNYNEYIQYYYRRLDFKGNTFLVQPFIQWKYKITDNLVLNTGLHGQYLTLNGSRAIEPRAGIKWNFHPKQSLSLGTGLHSQMQPTYIYYHQIKDARGNYYQPNTKLDFTRSTHVVLGYDLSLGAMSRLKIETYYQYLWGIPVDPFTSSFSLINQGSSFTRYFPGNTLFNKGTGRNTGIEFTLEKFFSKKFFFLATVSLYDSKFKGSDNKLRSTDYNGRYAFNALAGRDFKLNDKNTLSIGSKVTYAGGRLYSPANLPATMTNLNGDVVVVDSLRNTLRFKDYFRLDFRITYKINTKKLTHEFALDLVNILNTKNVLSLSYAPDPKDPTADPFKKDYQLGFLPLFYYKIDF